MKSDSTRSWRPYRSFILVFLALLATSSARSAPLGQILRDLNPAGYSSGSGPIFLGTVGGRAVFKVFWGEAYAWCWITDGTAEGTVPLEIGPRNPNGGGIEVTYLGTAASHLFLYVRDDAVLAVDAQGEVTRVLDVADGWDLNYLGDPQRHRVAGRFLTLAAWNTSSLTDVVSFIDGDTLAASVVHESPTSNTQLLGALGNELVFSVSDSTTSQDSLWRSAGTMATTSPYTDLSGQVLGSRATAGNSFVYFTLVEPGDVGSEVWVTNGSASGTARLTSFPDPGAQIGSFHVDGDRAFFSVFDASFGQELFASDATPGGTRAVTAFGFHQPFSSGEAQLAIAGGKAYFIATDGVSSNRLWLAGNRPEELRALVDNVALDSPRGWIATAGDSVFVPTADEQGYTHLFVSNGSAAGTHEVSTGCVDPCYLYPDSLAATSTTFYFTGNHPSSPSTTIYSTRPPFDTAQQLYQPLREGPIIGFALEGRAAVAGELVYFAAAQESGFGEPWLTAGTPATTTMIRRLATFRSSSDPKRFRDSGGALAFTADFESPDHVWLRSTPASALEPIAGDYDVCYYGSDVYPVTGGFIFRDCDDDFWSVPVSGGPASRLTDFDSGSPSVSLGNECVVGALHPSGAGYDVWRLSGSPPQTVLAQSITSNLGHWKFYAAGEAFLIDREFNHTRQLYSLGEELASYEPISPVFADLWDYVGSAELGRGFFGAADLEGLAGIWTTDGTAAGTRHLFPPAGYGALLDATRWRDRWAVLAQVGFEESYEVQVWATDGTPEGSSLLAALPSEGGFYGPRIVALGERLLFTHWRESGDVELRCFSAEGSEAVTLLPEGVSLSYRDPQLVSAGARVFFTACDTAHGCELWTTTGTPESTRLAHDILPGAQSSSPYSLHAVGGEVVFVADDGLHGLEPWHVAAEAGDDCIGAHGALCLEGDRYLVKARFKAPGNRLGDGQAIPLTTDTGAFWFFTPANVELIAKLIDGGGLNDHEWVFYGALSNIEYAIDVADAETGEARRYFNSAGRFASAGDIYAFPEEALAVSHGSAGDRPTISGALPPEIASETPGIVPGSCANSATRFCILGGRFAVEAAWRDFQGRTGTARAENLTDDTGYFWFFNDANIEIVLKAIDGAAYNGHFWIYYGALSNVEYTLTVTDTATGAVRQYRNPLGSFGSSGDITAFPAN